MGDLLQNSCSKSVLNELNYTCESAWPPPTSFWNKKKNFLGKIGVVKREIVSEKSDRKWHKKDGMQPKK